MVNENGLLQRVREEKIIAIMRDVPEEMCDDTVQALIDGGIVFMEFTLNTAHALRMISRYKDKYQNQLLIGAGTVLDIGMAKDAVAAGAAYLISPNLDESVIEYGLRVGVEVWPGTLTPTEIVRAYQAGASAVKVFPMGSLGLEYFKEIRAPLNNIPMIATGGVTVDNISAFLAAGAIAVGVGSSLTNKQFIKDRKFDELRSIARNFVNQSK